MEMRVRKASALARKAGAGLRYQSGFGNTFSSEATKGALPVGQNSPQRAPQGLFTEVLSGSAFTAPRAENSSVWMYRKQPSAMHSTYKRLDNGSLRSGPFEEETSPNRLRWDPLPPPERKCDFLESLWTVAGSGGPAAQSGVAVHLYRANRSMDRRYLSNADGELMFVPQQGEIRLETELGGLDVRPGEIAVVPRGMKFRVTLANGAARGYLCENYGAPFRLPELGPIGSQGLAQKRDFQAPVAAFEEHGGRSQLVTKFLGGLWAAELAHSPLDVVAWHGNYVPYKYDLARFMVINTVSFDHPDPSIFTVLTSPSGQPGVANCDFVIFPPRWMVAEHTFRPPWFHRNVMSELMGLVHGVHDSKAEGFLPGGVSIHNCMQAHGPDLPTYVKASEVELAPSKFDNALAFMWESRWVFRPTRQAMQSPQLQKGYDSIWDGFKKRPK
jgi:homogentisate 1,2-dioxygenase